MRFINVLITLLMLVAGVIWLVLGKYELSMLCFIYGELLDIKSKIDFIELLHMSNDLEKNK